MNTVGEHLVGHNRGERFRTKPIGCYLDEVWLSIGCSTGDKASRNLLGPAGPVT
ncbi:hypothetical protein SAMN05444004_1059 [Jannaschia faecimaris]|uniref:Uncharacterized protein n=1 Tax=Jannaschia faecimaris TaxID=1244108 RepID=A0A1H3PHK6_9RHOB|nr:hypothetical protein SAMN05444004_1059 [Jannaschia faecimaris]